MGLGKSKVNLGGHIYKPTYNLVRNTLGPFPYFLLYMHMHWGIYVAEYIPCVNLKFKDS